MTKSIKKTSSYRIKNIVLAIVFLLLIVLTLIKKSTDLARDPIKSKDCPPIQGDSLQFSQINSPIAGESVGMSWLQRGGVINDASCLDKTYVYGIVDIRTEADVQRALSYAKENKLKVSVAGVRHSMGGQAFFRDGLILDMRSFQAMKLNKDQRILTVQSGATWHDIQNFLHPMYAIKSMQSTDIFTVGGSISVNAHGMDHRVGAVSKTIQSLRIMKPDGTIEKISKTQNPDLFQLVIGGYGLFGVILDVDIEVTENVVYDSAHVVINYIDFPKMFEEIAHDPTYGLFYGHLSTAPSSFLREMIVYTYKTIDNQPNTVSPLTEVNNEQLRRFVINASKKGTLQKELKWMAEKYIEPRLTVCTVNRNQGMKEGESCLVSRNEPMHDSVKYLNNDFSYETDILHEYFVPRKHFVAYTDELRTVLQKHQTNLLNASVRAVHKEENTLTYAPEDMFSFVLYINQTTDQKGNEGMIALTRDLIDLTTRFDGRFFLPYQLHYTPEQLLRSYPEVSVFFAAKEKHDPEGLLTNTFYEKYGRLAEIK